MSDPATDAAIVEELAEALFAYVQPEDPRDAQDWDEARALGAALLPVVRRAQAAALREVADELGRHFAGEDGWLVGNELTTVRHLTARADAIEDGR